MGQTGVPLFCRKPQTIKKLSLQLDISYNCDSLASSGILYRHSPHLIGGFSRLHLTDRRKATDSPISNSPKYFTHISKIKTLKLKISVIVLYILPNNQRFIFVITNTTIIEKWKITSTAWKCRKLDKARWNWWFSVSSGFTQVLSTCTKMYWGNAILVMYIRLQASVFWCNKRICKK